VSAQENKALVRQFLGAVIAARDVSAADDLLSPEYTIHMPGLPQPVRGLGAWKELMGGYYAAFPDLEVGLEDEIADGDRVAIRYVWSGTHRGDFMGIPATGKTVSVLGTSVFRISEGLVAEEWHLDDLLGLMQQLGVVGQEQAAAPTR
jgi:steroid delta-isomerase-like uncharacterized protein